MKTVLEMLPEAVQARIRAGGMWDVKVYGPASLDDVADVAVLIWWTKHEKAEKYYLPIHEME